MVDIIIYPFSARIKGRYALKAKCYVNIILFHILAIIIFVYNNNNNYYYYYYYYTPISAPIHII
jgi:hypothetical protein